MRRALCRPLRRSPTFAGDSCVEGHRQVLAGDLAITTVYGIGEGRQVKGGGTCGEPGATMRWSLSPRGLSPPPIGSAGPAVHDYVKAPDATWRGRASHRVTARKCGCSRQRVCHGSCMHVGWGCALVTQKTGRGEHIHDAWVVRSETREERERRAAGRTRGGAPLCAL